MPDLGDLKLVDIREIWIREDECFTPWLFKEENLTRLANVLNLNLKPVEKEAEVGQFFADIVCCNKTDNSLVVIENQLEKSDHDHLGKTLTYATGLQVDTVIWIAKYFTNEHRKVIDELNDKMNGRQYFAVELEIIQINDSLPAPKFNIVAKPNRWMPPLANPNDDWYIRFWSEFRKYLHTYVLRGESSLHPTDRQPGDDQSYEGFDIGGSRKIWLAAWIHPKKNWIATNLHLQGSANQHFAGLKAYLEDRRSEFEVEIESEKRAISRIGVYNRKIDIENDRHETHKWLRLNLEKLDKLFRPCIKKLDLDSVDPPLESDDGE